MNCNTRTRRITLDWDLKWKMKYYSKKIYWYKPLLRAVIIDVRMRRSSTKGWHCEITTRHPIHEVRTRFELGDDTSRIVGDILRIKKINNILWNYKMLDGRKFKAAGWKSINKDLYKKQKNRSV